MITAYDYQVAADAVDETMECSAWRIYLLCCCTCNKRWPLDYRQVSDAVVLDIAAHAREVRNGGF